MPGRAKQDSPRLKKAKVDAQNEKKLPAILVVDDEPVYLAVCERALEGQGWEVVKAASGQEAIARLPERDYAAILLDVELGDMEGFDVARHIRSDPAFKHTPILFLTAYRTDTVDVDQGYALGAVDYLFKPFKTAALLAKVGFFVELHRKSRELETIVAERTAELAQTVSQLQAEVAERKEGERKLENALAEIASLKAQLEADNFYLRQEIMEVSSHHEILGFSQAIRKVLAAAHQVGPTDATVLILGETGSGKELVARAIHELSPRRSRPMIKVNCAALPASLIESELFGREKGAYTGAHAGEAGRFEAADGSTIFLDEIGELPLELQPKLLRVLQEGQFERLGSSRTIKVNVRVLAATNRDLAKEVRERRFREDLYYRLNVFPITIPPLRERPEDIPILVQSFVEEFATRMGKRIHSIPRRLLEKLQKYSWPGNVRELRNVIERAVILSNGPTLQIELPQMDSEVTTHLRTLREVEHKHILSVLEKTGWRIRGKHGAAEILGLKPTTLEARMKKLGISRPKPE